MARITVRLDDGLHQRLLKQSRRFDLGLSDYIRDVLERYEGGDPSGYHGRLDELQATAIQTLAIVAGSVGSRSPESLKKGMAEARCLLLERGLLDPEATPS